MRYRAFISYASADRPLAERFHRALEHYRIPKPLRGVDRGFGIVPKHITPIFRDRSDANAGRLSDVLNAALAESEALIVLCSPASARSEWVNKEIHTFRTLHENARIFAVVLSGLPRRFDPVRGKDCAFPPALVERIDANGQVVSDEAPLLAADTRPEGDGFDAAKLKIVAGLTGIPLVELTNRQQEADRRERRIIRAVAGTMAVLAVAATIAAVNAVRSANEARDRLSKAIEIAARRVDDAAAFRDRYGVPQDVIVDLLVGADEDFTSLIGAGNTGVPILELQRGRLHTLFSKLYGIVGDIDEQMKRARTALATLEGVRVTRQWTRPSTWFVPMPSRAELVDERLEAFEALAQGLWSNGSDTAKEAITTLEAGRDLASAEGRPAFVARFWALIGDHRYRTGDIRGADLAYASAIAALDQVSAGPPAEAAAIERAGILSDQGEMLLESGRPEEALDAQTKAIEVFERRVGASADDTEAQRQLAAALTRRGDARFAVDKCWTRSIPDFARAISELTKIYDSDRDRMDYAIDLTVAMERLADVRLQTRDLAAARVIITTLSETRRALYNRNQNDDDLKRGLASALEREGDLALGERNTAAAIRALDEARSFRPEPDPDNPADERALVLIRDSAMTWYKTGRAREAARAPAWRDAYARAIELLTPPVKNRTALAGWLRDLSIFHMDFGDGLLRAGALADARKHWTQALEYTEQDLTAHPTDKQLPVDRADLKVRLTTGRIPPDAGRVCRPPS